MSRKKQRDDKVIHVVFGPGGGRVERRDPKAIDAQAEPQSGREPLTDLFSGTEIARLLDVTPARLRTLDRAGVVSPTGRRKGRRAYTFSDLIALRTAQTLLSQRVRLRDVTRAVSALKRTLPKVTRPLQELRIVSDGQRVVVHTQDGAFEPLTGQMVLDFEVKSLRDDVVRVLRPSAGRERARTAYELYLRASQLDEDPATMDEAERLYNEAIGLDPWLAIAYTNLGNIRFRRHDAEGAETLYRRALEIDARQPEAQYNLGYVMLERGEPESSIPRHRSGPQVQRRLLQPGHGLRTSRRNPEGASLLEKLHLARAIRHLDRNRAPSLVVTARARSQEGGEAGSFLLGRFARRRAKTAQELCSAARHEPQNLPASPPSCQSESSRTLQALARPERPSLRWARLGSAWRTPSRRARSRVARARPSPSEASAITVPQGSATSA